MSNWQIEQIGAILQGETVTYGKFALTATSGHTAAGFGYGNSLTFVGKYPLSGSSVEGSWGELPWLFGKTSKGILEMGEREIFRESPYLSIAAWDVSAIQITMGLEYIDKGPGTFALSPNCGPWALGGARHIGIFTPNNLTSMGFTSPAKIKAWLDSLNYKF